jgi:hypothetical protein
MDHGERITQGYMMNRNDAEASDWVVVEDE